METTIKCEVCGETVQPLTSGVFQYETGMRVQFLCPEHANIIDRFIGELIEEFQ